MHFKDMLQLIDKSTEIEPALTRTAADPVDSNNKMVMSILWKCEDGQNVGRCVDSPDVAAVATPSPEKSNF